MNIFFDRIQKSLTVFSRKLLQPNTYIVKFNEQPKKFKVKPICPFSMAHIVFSKQQYVNTGCGISS